MEAKIVLQRWRQPRSSRRNEDPVRTLQVYKVHLLLEAQKLKFKTRWSLVTEQSTNLVLTLQMGFNPGTVWVFTWENQEANQRRILNERQMLLIAREEQKYFPAKAKSGVTIQEEHNKSIVQWSQLDQLVYAMIWQKLCLGLKLLKLAILEVNLTRESPPQINPVLPWWLG